MITISKITILTAVAAIFIITSFIPWTYFPVNAQVDTLFTPADKFGILEYNSTISFATVGTYSRASLENETWNFVNLNLNNSQQPVDLKVSAQDCNVTIKECQVFNTATSNVTFGGVILLYTVVGQGNQTFNFGLDLKDGAWSVSFNDNFVGENEGWSVSPDKTVTITDAKDTSNVTLAYFNFSGSFGGNGDNSNQPFYQQHSVAIVTAVAVVTTIIITVSISRKNKTTTNPSKIG